MPKEKVFKKLRLFVASPSDVGSQKDRANRVADRLNQSGGPADEAGVVLEVVRWESHVAPLMGRPQEVILEQVRADTWDIFVGILWLRFGSPSGAQSPDSGEEYASGTEEEFDLAYKLWQENKRPHILIYRCIKPPERMDTIDADQWTKINNFFSRFSPQGPTPGLYSTFLEWGEFENKLEQDLVRLLSLLRNDTTGKKRMGHQVPIFSFDPNALAIRFRQGRSYQVAFISVDIADHSKLVRSHPDNPAVIQDLILNFFNFAASIAVRHQGDVFSWAGDGGILIFEGERYRERAILAGLRLLNELLVFNLDSEQNPLRESIAIRLAAHEGPILFQFPTSSISSPDLNLVVHLQEKFTKVGEFCLTDTLLDNAHSKLSEAFSFKARFEGKPIFFFRAGEREDKPTNKTLNSVSEDNTATAEALKSILGHADLLEKDMLEVLSATLDGFYSSLQKVCIWFSTIDERWSTEYLRQVLDSVSILIDNETGVWDVLRGRYVQQKREIAEEHELEAIVQSNASRRSRPVLLLERLRREIQRRLGFGEKAGQQDDALSSRIKTLVSADDLEKEIVLTDLLLNFKGPLIDYLVNHAGQREHALLARHLWGAADLILQDELFSLYFYRRKEDRRISHVLSDVPVNDPYFNAIRSLLTEAKALSRQEIDNTLRRFGCVVDEVSIEMAWRCLAIGHPDQDTQRSAAEQLSLSSIWQMIARTRLPRNLIYWIGKRLKNRESQESQKIFCDCTRAAILEEIDRAEGRADIADLTRIILLLFEFDFMVETTYFERFDDLMTHFLQCVQKAGLKVDYFEKIRLQLDAARKERGAPSGDVPKNIRSLPLSIQRRLAGEAPYLLWFIGHPDTRVAMETLRHISLTNVERVLKVPEVNGELMRQVTSRDEFFSRAHTVMAALHNPKCPVEFARRYLPRLRSTSQGPRILVSISQSASANPAIRAMAKSILPSQSP